MLSAGNEYGTKMKDGSVLAQLDRGGQVPREEVVVVSKIGYVQGQNLVLAREREAAESLLKAGAHVIMTGGDTAALVAATDESEIDALVGAPDAAGGGRSKATGHHE